ncbi:uncharacterized protein LOC134247413 isoform X2 [Saccostrea cucullata]|uniref:uncharacterized protein LOC134247413 isoform X2 n=1 Tax=Saccostrea cuccullata TaxID=36930 RepID=UPI002ED6AA38
MYLVILFIVFCPSCQGIWSLSASPSTTIGKNNVTLDCYFYENTNKYNIIPEMIMEIRQNNTREDWKEVAMTNITGSYIVRTDQDMEIYIMSSSGCNDHRYWYYYDIFCRTRVVVSLTLNRCTIDPNLYTIFRCRVSNRSNNFESQEKSFVWTKGKSPNGIESLTIVKSRGERPGDVVQFKCIGEVESINGLPSQSIRWCKNISGKFTEISLQDNANTVVVSSSKDGCINVQQSEIFYHILQSDEYLEIMCESGYNRYTSECGRGKANSTIFIKTKTSTEEGQWKVYPILIYDETEVINGQYFNTQGIGRTIHLFCTASSFTSNEQPMNWCVKKTDNANWTRVVTQEDEIKSSANKSGGEIIMFSRITYHVTEYDKVVHFICEVSNFSTTPCGSGLTSSSLTIRINAHQTVLSEKERSATVTVLAVFLCLILITVMALVIILYRREELTIFGVVIKIERSSNRFQLPEENGNKVIAVPTQAISSKRISQSSIRYIEEPIKNNSKIDENKTECKGQRDSEDNSQGFYEEPDCTLVVRRQSVYENELLKDEILNEGEKFKQKTDSEICDYDELHIDEEQQNYEDLDL